MRVPVGQQQEDETKLRVRLFQFGGRIDIAHPENFAGFPPTDIASDVDSRCPCVSADWKRRRRFADVDSLQARQATRRRRDVSAQLYAGRVRRLPAPLPQARRRMARAVLEFYAARFEGRTDKASVLMLESLNAFQSLDPNRWRGGEWPPAARRIRRAL